jgi:hypothetical protein
MFPSSSNTIVLWLILLCTIPCFLSISKLFSMYISWSTINR